MPMAHILDKPEQYVGKSYTNDQGVSHCVEFIKQAMGGPTTPFWQEGEAVVEGGGWSEELDKGGSPVQSNYSVNPRIQVGTAIATFVNGKYPQTDDGRSMHAAIFLGSDATGIQVVDQWKGHAIDKRTIYFQPKDTRRSNDAKLFSIILW